MAQEQPVMEERVLKLEEWRGHIEPHFRALVALNLPKIIPRLLEEMSELQTAVAGALNEFTRAGHDLREASNNITGQAQVMQRSHNFAVEQMQAINTVLQKLLKEKAE